MNFLIGDTIDNLRKSFFYTVCQYFKCIHATISVSIKDTKRCFEHELYSIKEDVILYN